MIAYFVPLKYDKPNNPLDFSEQEDAGHILFLPWSYRTEIFKSNYFSFKRPPSQSRIGWMDWKVTEKDIVAWCRAQWHHGPGWHPAIIKFEFKDGKLTKEVYMDDYIEDFVKENYNEIIRRLKE